MWGKQRRVCIKKTLFLGINKGEKCLPTTSFSNRLRRLLIDRFIGLPETNKFLSGLCLLANRVKLGRRIWTNMVSSCWSYCCECLRN